MSVPAKPGMFRLVEQRQGNLSEVGDLDGEAAVLTRLLGDPGADGQPDAPGPRRGDDDLEGGPLNAIAHG